MLCSFPKPSGEGLVTLWKDDFQDTLLKSDGLLAFLHRDRSRKEVAKLLVLNFLDTALSSFLQTLAEQAGSIRDAYKVFGYRTLSYTAVEEHNDESSRYETLVDSAQHLVDTIEFVILSMIRSRREIQPRTEELDRCVIRVSDTEDEWFENIRGACTQLNKQAARIQAYHERRYNLYVSTLNIHESQSVKRLTALATGFLPLSLAAGLLSMQMRLADLKFILYDFVGVGFLLFFLMFMVYFVLKQFFRTTKWRPFGNLLSLDIRNMKIVSDRKERLLKIKKGREIVQMTEVVFVVSVATCTVASFLVGMLHSVFLGLKVWGYSVVATLGLFLVIPSLYMVLALFKGPRLRFRAQRDRSVH